MHPYIWFILLAAVVTSTCSVFALVMKKNSK